MKKTMFCSIFVTIVIRYSRDYVNKSNEKDLTIKEVIKINTTQNKTQSNTEKICIKKSKNEKRKKVIIEMDVIYTI